jgi:hypothetical protein
MNTKGSGPNDFRHSDDLLELIESENDALEQAKKDTEKRRRKARREYGKTQRFIEKEDLRRQIKINKDFDKLLKQEKKTATGRSRAPRISSANAESKLRSTLRTEGDKGGKDMGKRDCEGGEETAEGGFELEGRSPEVEEGIAEVEEERESTGETRRAEL